MSWPSGNQWPEGGEWPAGGAWPESGSWPEAGGSAYSPLSEGNGAFWLDFSVGSGGYSETAGTLTAVSNRVSSVAMTLDVAPGWSATAIGGARGGATFTGTQYMTTAEAAALAALDAQPHTVFIVSQYAAADADGCTLAAARAAGGNGYCRFLQTSAGAGTRQIGRRTTGTTNVTDALGTVTTNPTVEEWFLSATAVTLLLNGAATAIAGTAMARSPLGALVRLLVGAEDLSTGTAANFFNGAIGELLIYSVELGSAARGRVRGYLGSKWGIVVT